MPFGKDALTEENLYQIVETLAELRKNPEVLQNIRQYATSCASWGEILSELLVKPRLLYARQGYPGEQKVPFEEIAQELRKGNAVIVSVKLPNQYKGSDHCFTLEPKIGGRARVLHAWQDMHTLRAEEAMPIDELVGLLKGLDLELRPENVPKLKEIRGKLWGSDHADPGTIGEQSARRKISFDTVISGKPKLPLEFSENLNDLGKKLVGFSEEVKPVPRVQGPKQFAKAKPWAKAAGYGGLLGAGLGFVFAAGGVLLTDESEGKWKNAAIEGGKGALGGAIGGAVGGAAAKGLAPTFARLGVSVFRANILAGVAMSGVFAIWDVGQWAANNITAVDLRKRVAANLGGAAGGIGGDILAGIAGGAGGGFFFGPIGAAVGGVVGGITGGVAAGIGGAFGGLALDRAIWNEDEDSVMNSYEFFGWRSVRRPQRPVKTAKEIVDAYTKKLKDKPKEVIDDEWATFCTATLMVLLRAMYPEFVELLEMAKKLRENENDGVPIIGTAMFASLSRKQV